MSAEFPARLDGRTFADASSLAASMRKRAAADQLDHPGQAYPADHYLELRDPGIQAAIQQALLLLVDDGEADVVRFVLHLARSREVYAGLLHRLEGHGATLPASLTAEIASAMPGQLFDDPPLRTRALAAFRALGLSGPVVSMVMMRGSVRERVSAIALAAASHGFTESLAHFAGATLAAEDGAEPLIAAGASLFTQPEPVRRAFLAGALRSDPSWGERPELARTLRLPG